MKQLSIEEKAHRYDEALKEAVIAHKDEDRHLKATLERIFPELKVSDEQVAQKLHKLLCSEVTCEQFEKHGLTVDSALYWLEKQQKALRIEEAMRVIEQQAKAFTKANKGLTSDEILAQMRGQ